MTVWPPKMMSSPSITTKNVSKLISFGGQNCPWAENHLSKQTLLEWCGIPIYVLVFSPCSFLWHWTKEENENSKLQHPPVLVTLPPLPPTTAFYFLGLFRVAEYGCAGLALHRVIWFNAGCNPACTSFSKMCMYKAGSTKRECLFLIQTKLVNLGLFLAECSISLPVPSSLHVFCHIVFLSYRHWMNENGKTW